MSKKKQVEPEQPPETPKLTAEEETLLAVRLHNAAIQANLLPEHFVEFPNRLQEAGLPEKIDWRLVRLASAIHYAYNLMGDWDMDLNNELFKAKQARRMIWAREYARLFCKEEAKVEAFAAKYAANVYQANPAPSYSPEQEPAEASPQRTSAPKPQQATEENGPERKKFRQEIMNNPATSLIRWMGRQDWSKEDAERVLVKLGWHGSPITLAIQLKWGKGNEHKIASLTKDQVAKLEKMKGEK